MKTRPTEWLNLRTNKPAYGFDVWVNGKWMTAVDDDKLIVFDNQAERDRRCAELRDVPVRVAR